MPNLIFTPPQPQVGDSELTIDHKTAVNVSRIADALGAGGVRLATTTVGADFDFLSADFARYVDASSWSVTGTLPAATGSGRMYLAVKIDDSDNIVTVSAQGSDLIDGSVSVNLTSQWSDCLVQDAASGFWHSIGGLA